MYAYLIVQKGGITIYMYPIGAKAYCTCKLSKNICMLIYLYLSSYFCQIGLTTYRT